MRNASGLALALALALVACNGGKGDGYLFETKEDALLAAVAMRAPLIGYSVTLSRTDEVVSDCPSVDNSEDFFLDVDAAGSCTDPAGFVWRGDFEMSDQLSDSRIQRTVVFNSWGINFGDESFTLDGTLVLTGANLTDLDIMKGDDIEASINGTAVTYGSYQLTGDVAESILAFPALVSIDAQVTTGDGFSLLGDWEEGAACDSEPLTGKVNAQGANRLTLSFNGGTACDACGGWVTDDDLDGKVCGFFDALSAYIH